MLIRDIYVLGESGSFTVKMREEVMVNLELKKAPRCYHTLFTGEVLFWHLPIKNATVLVMDENYAPLSSSITDEQGIFKFSNVLKPGKYYAVASAVGYVTSEIKTILINPDEISRQSFSLKKSPIYLNGIVYGKVLEAGSRKPIEGADVYLNSQSAAQTNYKTSSNHKGQYLIYNIIPGSYEMAVKKQGYFPAEPLPLTIEKYSRLCLYFDLISAPAESKNTISGVITNDKEPIPKAAVFLYSIDKEKNEKIVQMQETNENGLFLFTNVESGTYLVKGKQQNSVIYEKSFEIE